MAQNTNSLQSVDQTIRIFDEFYAFQANVNTSEYDIVNGYFLSVCGTKEIANNFTTFLFRISSQTKIPVLNLLNNVKGLSKLEMNKNIAYYLNSFKSKTSLYGVGVIPQPNQSVARNVVQ